MTQTAKEKALAEGEDSQTTKGKPNKTQPGKPDKTKIDKDVADLVKQGDAIGEKSATEPGKVTPDKKTFNAKQAFDAGKIKKVTKTQIPGSVNSNVMINAEEKEYVHFYVTDYSAPRPTDGSEDFVAPRVKKVLYPQQFVRSYGATFSNNKRFENITSPFVIYLILRNINEAIIKERFEDELEKVKGGVAAKRKRVQLYLKEMKKLRQNGSTSKFIVTLEDIVHIPEATKANPFGFDRQYVDMFPEGV